MVYVAPDLMSRSIGAGFWRSWPMLMFLVIPASWCRQLSTVDEIAVHTMEERHPPNAPKPGVNSVAARPPVVPSNRYRSWLTPTVNVSTEPGPVGHSASPLATCTSEPRTDRGTWPSVFSCYSADSHLR